MKRNCIFTSHQAVGLSATCVCCKGAKCFSPYKYFGFSLRLQFKLAMGKCVFNHKWLSDPNYSWVKEFKGDKHKAVCCICKKVNNIERMGESAQKSQMKGDKHFQV